MNGLRLKTQSQSQRAVELSVLIPTWNEREALPALLASLKAAGGADEVVVADAESPDGTAEIARELGARVVFSEPGRGTQLRIAASAARGALLVILHADVRLEPGSLDAVRRAFEDPELAAAGMCQKVEHAGRAFRGIERSADARVRRGWVYGDSGLCVRRSAYEAVGGFQEIPLFEDLELSKALQDVGRIELVDGAMLHLSPRRWLEHGVVRQTLRNKALVLAWRLGVSPARLARAYARR